MFVDADNTLWDTDSVYAAAQLALLEAVETELGAKVCEPNRLAYVRMADQQLAERHHSGLRYPPRLLAKALALTLSGMAVDTAARRARSTRREGNLIADSVAMEIERAFLTAARASPKLRTGVRTGLKCLDEAGHPLVVLTEGSRARALKVAQERRIGGYFHRIIEGTKSQRLFQRVLQATGQPDVAFMVGDQLERDIRPAKAAGLRTIFFPGRFRPRWEPEEAEVVPDYSITSFMEVPHIVDRAALGIAPGRISSR